MSSHSRKVLGLNPFEGVLCSVFLGVWFCTPQFEDVQERLIGALLAVGAFRNLKLTFYSHKLSLINFFKSPGD